MTITLFSEHVAQGLSRLLAQYKDKENIAAVITALIQQVQDLEDVIYTLKDARTIDAASGDLLDVIGRILNQSRMGLSDEDYRIWLKARLAINKSSGTIEELITVIKLITGFEDAGDILIEEDNYPAYFLLTIVPALGTIDPYVVKAIIDAMRSAAVEAFLFYHVTDPVFTFDIGPGFDQGYLAGII